MILIVDDDHIMARCLSRACSGHEIKICHNAVAAMDEISSYVPQLIFLDVLLDGPDGFTLINELASYADTAEIPIVIVSSLELQSQTLSPYNIVGVLSKDTMTPEEISAYARKYDA